MSEERAGPLWQLSATELIAAYGRGTTTPQEVLAATLERVEESLGARDAEWVVDGGEVSEVGSPPRKRARQKHVDRCSQHHCSPGDEAEPSPAR